MTSKVLKAAFATGGDVTLHLGVGEATVVSNPSSHEIVVTTRKTRSR